MLNINRIVIRGNVGNEPRINQVGNRSVANISVATNFKYSGKDGNPILETTWHNVVLWENPQTPNLSEIHKGMIIQVEGRLRSRKYTNRDGLEVTTYEIVADDAVIVQEPKRESDMPNFGNNPGF